MLPGRSQTAPVPPPPCSILLLSCSHPSPTPLPAQRDCPAVPVVPAQPLLLLLLQPALKTYLRKTACACRRAASSSRVGGCVKEWRRITREPGSPRRPSWAPGEWGSAQAWCCSYAHGSSWFILHLRGRDKSLMGTGEGRR